MSFTKPLTLLLLLTQAIFTHAQNPTPCPYPNPCKCTAEIIITILTPIPGTLTPPTAWLPVTNIIPTIDSLLLRDPPTKALEGSFLREIEAASNAMFASQFAAHTVANNAFVKWKSLKTLFQQFQDGKCDNIPVLQPAPTADVFAQRFPPTPSLLGRLISYEALRTVVKPMQRALKGTELRFTNFTRNADVKDAVESVVELVEGIVEAGFEKGVTEKNLIKIDAIDLDGVFGRLLYGWYRARRYSERRVLLAVADQVEPLRRPSICALAPVNNITCALCT